MKETNLKQELKKVFEVHTIVDVKNDLEKMFLSFICSDDAEDSSDRQSATLTFQLLKKVLDQIQ